MPASSSGLNLPHLILTARRRSTLILAVAAAVVAVASIAVARLPDVYAAKTTVYLDPGGVPRGLERAGLPVPRLPDLLATLSQEVLSRETLRTLIQEVDLYEPPGPPAAPAGAARAGGGAAEESGPAPDGEGWNERLLYAGLIQQARNDIAIELVKVYARDLVEISVRARRPDLAANAVNRIAELLVTKNRDLRLARAREVNAFMDSELERARAALSGAKAALDRFRAEHRDSLPETEPRLLAALADAGRRMAARRAAIDEANARREGIRLTIDTLYLGRPAGGGTGGETAAGPLALADSPELRLLETEQRRLDLVDAELAARYPNPDFPDRVAARARLDRVRQRLEELRSRASGAAPAGPGAEGGGSKGGAAPPGPRPAAPAGPEELVAELVRRGASPALIGEVRGLVAELAMLATRVKTAQREHERDLAENARIESALGSIGPVAADLERIEAAVAAAARVHDRVLADVYEARRFLHAEEALSGDMLKTAELADAPLLPAGPPRLLMLGAALLLGLGTGGGIAWLLEKDNEAYRDEDEIQADLGVETVAALPAVRDPERIAAAAGVAEGTTDTGRDRE